MSTEDIRVAWRRGHAQGAAEWRRRYEELAEEVRLYGLVRGCPPCGTSWTPASVRACPTCGEECGVDVGTPATPEATA